MSFVRLFDLQGLGNALAGDEMGTDGFHPMFDRFQHVDRATYTFLYQYTPTISDNTTLHDVVVPPDSQPVPFDQLPESEKKAILSQKELTKNQAPTAKVKPPV